jgi:hypothetical protein
MRITATAKDGSKICHRFGYSGAPHWHCATRYVIVARKSMRGVRIGVTRIGATDEKRDDALSGRRQRRQCKRFHVG